MSSRMRYGSPPMDIVPKLYQPISGIGSGISVSPVLGTDMKDFAMKSVTCQTAGPVDRARGG